MAAEYEKKVSALRPGELASVACLSCHTSQEAVSHALLNPSTLGESCRVCHGTTSEFSVDRSMPDSCLFHPHQISPARCGWRLSRILP